ncbi:MAG: hypothetical protein LQ346_000496 [Caloplaca aetnensis]|nr:MAG: hypothetical protein LQ346_000496 [Caloplaca aetnensis]
MPVTIKPAGHEADTIYQRYRHPVKDTLDMFKRACPSESGACKEMFQSSFGPEIDCAQHIKPSSNGFVRGAILAYSHHHHLRIRPEDVWFAILNQLGFYINAHAEEFRGQFAKHEGKVELEIVYASENRYTVDYALFARQMSGLIEQNVVDPELRKWMMPAFTTVSALRTLDRLKELMLIPENSPQTTESDMVIASILLMGATQEYFTFRCTTRCGLPSVTLLGEKADWELILTRIEKLKEYGEEPTMFYSLLEPVLSRFINSFDNPSSKDTAEFWQQLAHHDNRSGRDHYSGWITAFCFWTSKGKSLYQPPNPNSWSILKLDGAAYHIVYSGDVPPAYTAVPVKMDDNGDKFDATMVAGSVGMRYISSKGEGSTFDTIQAESGWWMFDSRE